jgi:hypothetical protein
MLDGDGDTTGEDTPEVVFRVIKEFKSDNWGRKVEIDAPAPWNTPDEVTDPNEVVKSIGEWAEYHWQLDTDVGIWTLDADAIEPLREAATAAGYEWVDDRGADPKEDTTTNESPETDVLDRLTELAEQGDQIEVRYEQKNGNGINSKAGEVEVVETGEGEYGRTVSEGVIIRRSDEHVNEVRRDNNDEPSVFSRATSPYMGELISASIIPDDGE